MASAEEEKILIKLLAGSYFDALKREFVKEQLITVHQESGIIVDVRPISPEEAASLLDKDHKNVIDLRKENVLPGFVDTHVHCEHVYLNSASSFSSIHTLQ